MGLYFEDFYPGLKWVTEHRTISRDDINAFITLFGDNNTLHVDEEYAKSKGYAGIIAHGPFRIALVTGLTSELGMLNETNIGVIDMNWKFKGAVCVGDTIHVELEVTECRRTSNPARGIVKREYRAINQRGEIVDLGMMVLLVQARTDGKSEN